MGRSEVYSDIGPEKFRERVEDAHDAIDPSEEDPVDWFRQKVGRSRSWVEERFSGRKDVPRYAATILRQLEREAYRGPMGPSPLDGRRDRAEQFCDDLRELREGLEDGAGAFLEVFETVERLLGDITDAKTRVTAAVGSIVDRMQTTERRIRKEADAVDRVEFGDRDGNEDEARDMARKAG